MATSNQVEQRIKELDKEQRSQGQKLANLEGRISIPKPEGWLKKRSYWISPLVSLIGIAVGTGFMLRFFTLTVDERISSKLEGPMKEFHQVQVDVGKLNGKLETLVELEKARIQRLSELRPEDLKARLPEVADALSAASALGAFTSEDVKNSLKRNLSLIRDRDSNFWPAAAAMVSYRSGDALPKLPPCRLSDQPPAKLAEDMSAEATSFKFALIPFENCEVVLDSPEAQDRYLKVLGLFDIEFRHCRVIYRGGPLFFPARVVPGRKTLSLIFEDCVFEMSTRATPPKDGQEVVSRLLVAENPKSARVTISTS